MDIFELMKQLHQHIGVYAEHECSGCTHKVTNPDGGYCYMFEHFQPGCMLYELPKKESK